MGYAQEELDKAEFKVETLVVEVLRKEKVILNLQENLDNTGTELIQVKRDVGDIVEEAAGVMLVVTDALASLRNTLEILQCNISKGI